MSEDASQPTKKQANERTTSQVPTTTVKWGPFSPPTATTVKVLPPSLNTSTSAQKPVKDNRVGAIWKNPPTGSSSSSQKPPASTNNLHKAPSLKVPASSTLPKAPGNLKAPALRSQKVAEKPSGYGKENPPTLLFVSLPNIPPSITSKSLKYPSTSSFDSDQPSLNLVNSNEKSRKEDVHIEIEEKNCEETKKSSNPVKSLRSKSHPDWPMNVDDFDDKEEALTVVLTY
uniref:Uncharacterized protein n=1 Tax=Chenopodium quinoa TaxID=63459 RepID=A0A803NF37_CHEQI